MNSAPGIPVFQTSRLRRHFYQQARGPVGILQHLSIDASEILLSFSPKTLEKPEIPLETGMHFTQEWGASLRKRPLLLDPFTAEAIEAIKRTLTNEFERGVSHVGYWDWNLTTGEFHWSMQMYSIYEVEFDSGTHGNPLLERLHPEDAKKVKLDIQNLVQKDIPYSNTHRAIANGKTFLVRGSARKYVNTRNEILIFGIAERRETL